MFYLLFLLSMDTLDIQSPILQGNPVKLGTAEERHLIPMNLIDKPVAIKKLTKSVANEYLDRDLFGQPSTCALFEFEYSIKGVKGIGRVMVVVDGTWSRLVWTFKGAKGIYSYGSYCSGEGQFIHPSGIDGRFPDFFVADPENERIVHLKFSTSEYGIPNGITFVRIIGVGKLLLPTDVAYSDNGTEDKSDDIIYVADYGLSRVFKFEANTGDFISKFGKTGKGEREFWSLIGISVGKENGYNTKDIYVIDRETKKVISYYDIGSYDTSYFHTFDFGEDSKPISVACDYFGCVYVADNKNNRIAKLSPDLSTQYWTYGSTGFGEGKFYGLNYIWILNDELIATEAWTDSSGISYYWIESVKDITPPVVQILSPPDTTYINGEIKIIGTVKDDYLKCWQVYIGEGAYPDTFELIEWGTGQKEKEVLAEWNSLSYSEITSILLLAQDEGGNISTDTVRVWVGEPKIELSIGRKYKKCCKISIFKLPLDVAVDDNLNIYVSNTYYRRIQKFNREGSYLYSFRTFFRTYWKRWWSWTKPGGIAAWRDKIFVVNSSNRRIQVFDTTGSYLYEFDNLGSKHRMSDELVFEGDSDICSVDTGDSFLEELSSSSLEEPSCWDKKPNLFIHPFDVALTEEGNVFVSDMSSHRIHKFTSEGSYISSFGTWGDSTGEFKNPCGIDIMGNQIAVADRENDRVQLLSLSGEAKRIVENEFDRPFDVGFDSDTSLYVVDCNKNRVQKFDRFGNHLLTIYDNSLKLPTGCDVKDALYLSDTHNDRVLKFPGWFSAPRNERLEMFRELLSRNNSLSLVYPNPCSQEAKIYLSTEGKSESTTPGISSMGSTSSHSVQLDIYNISGRKVRELFNGQINTRQYLFNWDLRDEKGSVVPSGVYFYRLMVDENAESNKIVVVR